MYIMCVILCLFSALSRRVGALQISIIITTAKHLIQSNSTLHNHHLRGVRKSTCTLTQVTGLGTHAKSTETERALCGSHVCKKRGKSDTESHNALWLLWVSKLVFYTQSTGTVISGRTLTGKISSVSPL